MAGGRPLRTGQTSHYAELAGRVSSLQGTVPAWLREKQAVALHEFETRGFPLPSDEEWRFTPIGPIAETLFDVPPPVSEGATAAAVGHLARLEAVRMVFVNGWLSQGLPDEAEWPSGVEVGALRHLPETPAVADLLGTVAGAPPSFADLNLALVQDGLYVNVAPGAVVATPVHAVYLALPTDNPTVVSPRSLVVVGRGSRVVLVESFLAASGGEYWTNAVTEIVVEDGATLEHYRLQREDDAAYHTGRTAVRLGRDAVYTSFSVHTGAAIGRHDLTVTLAGEGGNCTLNGLYIGRGRQLLDNHTLIDHAVPHCESHEVYKGILADRAHGVFNGKVLVRQDAQKTDAKQSNHVLLLSEAAHIDTKPQLEIFADDVRCTHGATVGQLDAQALFYLRSRGIGLQDARSILIHAFASDIVDRIPLEAVREDLEQLLLASLPKSSSLLTG